MEMGAEIVVMLPLTMEHQEYGKLEKTRKGFLQKLQRLLGHLCSSVSLVSDLAQVMMLGS